MLRISTLQIVSVVNLSVMTHALTVMADFPTSTALPGLSPAHRVLPHSIKYRALLVKLDSIVQPGVPQNTLSLLLVKCKKCGQVTTRRVFLYHTC